MQDLVAGRAAVVTGGARGIGLAVVEAIAARGVAVLCLDHPDADYTAFEDDLQSLADRGFVLRGGRR